ncbi:uncharacterized protein tsnare1 isoform X2 [Sphaeramia orbicularis]|uniref:uncharacterized protein tsnare1 isoform X2 n=1 Tax=Sphaeramia orbicularis TaxID=375764 RepID=UPI001180ECA4|nr:t-SNARE domain-containing protein 1 isoform X2 [Sphaeramia orbicularis]
MGICRRKLQSARRPCFLLHRKTRRRVPRPRWPSRTRRVRCLERRRHQTEEFRLSCPRSARRMWRCSARGRRLCCRSKETCGCQSDHEGPCQYGPRTRRRYRQHRRLHPDRVVQCGFSQSGACEGQPLPEAAEKEEVLPPGGRSHRPDHPHHHYCRFSQKMSLVPAVAAVIPVWLP